MDRVRKYLAVCERQTAGARRPRSAEEYTTCGVMHHNEGDSQQAIKNLTKALELEPRSAHIQYLLAAAHARAGDVSATAKHLKQAIQTDPTNLVLAKANEDFEPVRHEREVAALIIEIEGTASP